MTAYPPKAMAVVCILMEAEARTYRKMVGHLRMNRNLAMKTGLPKIPSKSTIWRAYGMIPEPYLREVHTRIIGDVMVTGSLAGDSTGYSDNRFVRWFSIRHDQVRLKRGWVKLHSICILYLRLSTTPSDPCPLVAMASLRMPYSSMKSRLNSLLSFFSVVRYMSQK